MQSRRHKTQTQWENQGRTFSVISDQILIDDFG